MGQDGRLMSELLLELDYNVVGVTKTAVYHKGKVKQSFAPDQWYRQVNSIIGSSQPEHIFYFAAYHQSSADIYDDDELALIQPSFDINVNKFFQVLESVRLLSRSTRVFYAASSHIFNTQQKIDEKTAPAPKNIYGISKLAGVNLAHFYRDKYNLFIAVGYLFNHESTYRKPNFISRKIIESALKIYQGQTECKIEVAAPDAEVDWGYAKDYMQVIYQQMSLPSAEDLVIASGVQNSVATLVKMVCEHLDLNFETSIAVKGSLHKASQCYRADITKMNRLLNTPMSRTFEHMVKTLVDDYMKIKGILGPNND
jgi:GDPmannose 4,6-dehydratase